MGADGKKTKKKKHYSPESTLESYQALNMKKLDLGFSVDPLFHRTSAQFDAGGAKGACEKCAGVLTKAAAQDAAHIDDSLCPAFQTGRPVVLSSPLLFSSLLLPSCESLSPFLPFSLSRCKPVILPSLSWPAPPRHIQCPCSLLRCDGRPCPTVLQAFSSTTSKWSVAALSVSIPTRFPTPSAPTGRSAKTCRYGSAAHFASSPCSCCWCLRGPNSQGISLCFSVLSVPAPDLSNADACV